MEFRVYIEREKADEDFVLLHDNRHRRRIQVGPVGAHHDVDFVDIEQLRVDARNVRRIGLVVVIDQFDLAAEQTALGVDFLLPDLRAEQRLLAVRRQRTGERHAKADLDRLAALRGCR